MGAVRPVHGEPVPRRFRSVVLLSNAGLQSLPRSVAELVVARGGGHGVLAAGRHPDRHSCGGAGRSFLGQRGQDICTSGAFAAVILRRAGADPGVLGLSRLAALVWVWRPVAHSDASLRPGLVLCRVAHAIDPVLNAGGARVGIYQVGTSEGPARITGDSKARIQECADPGSDIGWHQPGAHDQCRGGGGDGVCLARHRALALRRNQFPRFPYRTRCGDHGWHHDRCREPAGRYRLCRDRPTDQSGDITAMSITTETLVLPAASPPRASLRRSRDLPLIPITILAVIALTAIFANVLAPHNPEVGSLTA